MDCKSHKLEKLCRFCAGKCSFWKLLSAAVLTCLKGTVLLWFFRILRFFEQWVAVNSDTHNWTNFRESVSVGSLATATYDYYTFFLRGWRWVTKILIHCLVLRQDFSLNLKVAGFARVEICSTSTLPTVHRLL